MKIKIKKRDYGSHLINEVCEVAKIIPHGVYTNQSPQYVLVDDTHVVAEHAEVVETLTWGEALTVFADMNELIHPSWFEK